MCSVPLRKGIFISFELISVSMSMATQGQGPPYRAAWTEKQRAKTPCFKEQVWPLPYILCPRRPWPGGPRAHRAASGLYTVTRAVPLKQTSPTLSAGKTPHSSNLALPTIPSGKSEPAPLRRGTLRAANRSPDSHAGAHPPPRPGCVPPQLSAPGADSQHGWHSWLHVRTQ